MEKHLDLGVEGFEVKRIATFVIMLTVQAQSDSWQEAEEREVEHRSVTVEVASSISMTSLRVSRDFVSSVEESNHTENKCSPNGSYSYLELVLGKVVDLLNRGDLCVVPVVLDLRLLLWDGISHYSFFRHWRMRRFTFQQRSLSV